MGERSVTLKVEKGSRDATVMCPYCGSVFNIVLPGAYCGVSERELLLYHQCDNCGAEFIGCTIPGSAAYRMYKYRPASISECLLPEIESLDDFVNIDFAESLETMTQEVLSRKQTAVPLMRCYRRVEVYGDSSTVAYYNLYGFVLTNSEGTYSILTCSNESKFAKWEAHEVPHEQSQVFTIIETALCTLVFHDKNDAKIFLRFSNERDKKIEAFVKQREEKDRALAKEQEEQAKALSEKELLQTMRYYNKLENTDTASTAWENLLNILPSKVFINADCYRQFLHTLSENDGTMERYLHSTGTDIYIVDKEERFSAEPDDALKTIVEFESLACEKYDIPDYLCRTVSYLLLVDAAKEKFGKMWEQEYRSNLDDRKADSIDSYISNCVMDDTISIQDLKGMMLLSWQLLRDYPETIQDILSAYSYVHDIVAKATEEKRKRVFADRIFGQQTKDIDSEQRITIDDIDLMTGTEFEQFIADHFRRMGYSASVTKQSGDQGVDIIAEKNGIRIGIQAKCYGGAVGNAAVQEVVAGKNYYHVDKVMVITNNYFTPAAIQLAQANNVVLWDRAILKEKL